MVDDIGPTELKFDITADELQSIAFVTFGIILIIANLSVLVGQVFQYYQLASTHGENQMLESQMQVGITISILKIGFGVVLIWGGGSIVRFLKSLRHAGIEHKD